MTALYLLQLAKTVLSIDSNVDHYRGLIQEQQTRITLLELEIQQLREAGLQLGAVDLSVWMEKINVLYTTKKTLHQEILTLESKEKILKWRIKYKHNNAERINAFDNSDDEVSCK